MENNVLLVLTINFFATDGKVGRKLKENSSQSNKHREDFIEFFESYTNMGREKAEDFATSITCKDPKLSLSDFL